MLTNAIFVPYLVSSFVWRIVSKSASNDPDFSTNAAAPEACARVRV